MNAPEIVGNITPTDRRELCTEDHDEIGHHEDSRDDPDGEDGETGSTESGAQLERVDDGVVAFQRDGGQRQHGHGHRDTLHADNRRHQRRLTNNIKPALSLKHKKKNTYMYNKTWSIF